MNIRPQHFLLADLHILLRQFGQALVSLCAFSDLIHKFTRHMKRLILPMPPALEFMTRGFAGCVTSFTQFALDDDGYLPDPSKNRGATELRRYELEV